MSIWKIPPNKWIAILAFLRDCPNAMVGSEENCMNFIEATMWMARSEAPWRTLPSEYGNWNGVYKRFAGWSDRDVRRRMYDAFVCDPDMKFILIDSADSEGAPSGGGSSRKKKGTVVSSLRKERRRLQRLISTLRSLSVSNPCGSS